MNFTAEQVEAAVAAATSEMSAAIERAKSEAVASERERFRSILEASWASGKPKLALAAALSGATLEVAEAMLSAAAPEATVSSLGLRSRDAPGGLVTVGAEDPVATGSSEVAAVWSRSVARANSKFESDTHGAVK
ncbi:MAG: hypothetical protein K2W78_12770 [Xanthobacteraceae bacterium]|nr:hypothetical protein [Xanthobacteraceae bacterium]